MRFRFESKTSEGLKVLPEIPDVTTCLIEGRNGIGKTVAVRLLELISGRQPFDGFDRQWHSLRQRLGRTVVEIDAMKDGDRLRFEFTPDAWEPDGKPPLALGDWLGRGELNGEAISVAEAQGLLWVERFAGNEDLDDILRRRTELYADRAERTSTVVSEAARWVVGALDPLRTQVLASDPADLSNAREDLREAEEEQLAVRAKLSELEALHAALLAAIDARDRLARAENPAGELREKLEDLRTRLGTLDDERQSLEKSIEATRSELERQGDPQATLGDAQRTLRYRRKRLRNVESEIERLSSEVGIEADKSVVETAETQILTELAELEQRRLALDASGVTVRLIDGVLPVLDDPAAAGMDELILIESAEYALTISQTKRGLEARREHLRGEPRPDEVDTLVQETNRLKRRLATIRELARQLVEASKISDRVVEAESDEKHAEEAVKDAGHRDEQYRTDNQRLGAIEEEIDKLNVEITDIHIQLGLEGGRSLEDARVDLASQLEILELESGDQLDEREHDHREKVNQVRVQLERATDRVMALRRNVTVLEASIEAAVASIRADARFEALRDALPPSGDRDVADAYSRLRTGILELIDQLERTRDLVQVLGQFARTALGHEPMVSDRELFDGVRAVLADELVESLDSGSIRERLFAGGRIRSIDLAARELVLDHGGQIGMPRPFDTFSTGEQAFAFTQARILELEPSTRPNRLLVLDEFGAFVAADRLPDLAEFLRSPKVKPIADQVLVVLPLQVDYEAEIDNTTGALRARYEDRVGQLKERSYYTQELEA